MLARGLVSQQPTNRRRDDSAQGQTTASRRSRFRASGVMVAA